MRDAAHVVSVCVIAPLHTYFLNVFYGSHTFAIDHFILKSPLTLGEEENEMLLLVRLTSLLN